MTLTIVAGGNTQGGGPRARRTNLGGDFGLYNESHDHRAKIMPARAQLASKDGRSASVVDGTLRPDRHARFPQTVRRRISSRALLYIIRQPGKGGALRLLGFAAARNPFVVRVGTPTSRIDPCRYPHLLGPLLDGGARRNPWLLARDFSGGPHSA